MKTRTKTLIILVSSTILCAWTTKQTTNIKKAEWLKGTWENKTSKGSVYETWSKSRENEFNGKSYIVKDKDTIIFETIKLVQEQNGLFYIPRVKNQNENLPVRFLAKTISETQLVFENLQHDFPQTISYTKITSDSLVAEISGTKNGQQRKQTFPMKLVQ
ncbi:DUF6265 family protein [Aquimarina sp. 2-A2]|uniref:DUF6265 family protein n=1 Tax=Aquimarina sp. 2-A2 TaxID=3382644 RepID=UPI00387EEEB9